MLDVAIEIAGCDEGKARAVRTQIAAAAREYRKLLDGSDDPAVRADAFRRLLFEVGKMQSVAKLDSTKQLFIDGVLSGRKGYCLSLSVLALVIAEEVGAPLHGVALPNHFFVRYDDGKFRRNLELTRKGATLPEETVGKFEEGSVYGRNLKPQEVKAFLLHNRGYVALLQKKYEKARVDFEAAIKLLPGLGEAHRNLGVLLGEKKDWKGAKRAFIRAININAKDTHALVNLAICRHALGERDAALQELELVLTLDPDQGQAEQLRERWKAEARKPRAKVRAAMPAAPKGLRPGLRARYYAGMKFNRLALERIDKDLSFDWQNEKPAKEVPRDRFSVRWEGYFKAPVRGTYTFFVVANDGVRLVIGGKTVVENWRNMGLRNHRDAVDVVLEAGWHAIKVEHFDGMGGARMMLLVGVDDREQPLKLADHLFHATGRKR